MLPAGARRRVRRDRAVRGIGVEVPRPVEARVAVLAEGDPAVGDRSLPRHVIDHGVDDHLDPGLAAGRDHGPELGLRAHPAVQRVVGRLVDLPPGVQHGVAAVAEALPLEGVRRRRDLHAAVARGPEDRPALGGDRRPAPLEQVGGDVAHLVLGAPRLGVVGGRGRLGVPARDGGQTARHQDPRRRRADDHGAPSQRSPRRAHDAVRRRHGRPPTSQASPAGHGAPNPTETGTW